jgi:hypothetical protein
MAAGIEHPNVVDLVTVDGSGEYALIMIETRPWTNSSEQLQQLREKINTYAMFALDEGMVATYPQSAGQPLRFQLDCADPPTAEAAQLIETAGRRLSEHKIRFVVNVQQ